MYRCMWADLARVPTSTRRDPVPQVIWPHITRGRFNAADLDESGYLSADEYNALVRNPPE